MKFRILAIGANLAWRREGFAFWKSVACKGSNQIFPFKIITMFFCKQFDAAQTMRRVAPLVDWNSPLVENPKSGSPKQSFFAPV